MRFRLICTALPPALLAPAVGCSIESGSGVSAAGGADSTATGGAATGGVSEATGGVPVATGGAATGGTAAGGVPLATGGRASGGTATGGKAAGGVSAATGGAPTGGAATGGAPLATGGRANGGRAAGGMAAGGVSEATGGTTASGGTTANGGTTATGGTTASGGTSGTATCKAVIPAINGTCPTFATGSVTVAGLSGISLQVGTKSQGTGSLLFYWHGTGSSTAEVSTLIPSAVRQSILDQGGIIVAFQSSLGTGGDCSGTATFSKDDLNVADQIAACAVRDHNIDPCRIYTTGCSAGGLQSGCMAALRSSYVAAAVPNSGGEVMEQTIQDESHIPAIMTMHGGSTDVVVIPFSTTSATLDKQMKAAGGFVVNCNHGGGHCQAPSELYTAAWEFMQAHPFGVSPEPYASGLPASYPSYCALY